MGERTEISWCDSTFNPWIGCTKVSPGCANCYAETLMDHRYGKVKWGKGQPRVRTSAANWKLPLKWNREAGESAVKERPARDDSAFGWRPRRPRVFCASLADVLDEEVPIEWLADLLKLIHDTPYLDWLCLSKRVELFFSRLKAVWDAQHAQDWPGEEHEGAHTRWLRLWINGIQPPDNVWIGTSVENQEMADKRIPELLKIPAKVRFLSMEPVLGPVDLSKGHVLKSDHDCPECTDDQDRLGSVNWVIAGGESGRNARPSHPDWFRSIRDQCQAAEVPFFMKQMEISGKVTGDIGLFPPDLQRREFPNA